MADDPIRAALREAEDALLRHLWEHDGCHDPAELTPERVAAIRSYGVDSGWNIKTRGAAAAIAACLRAPGMWAALAEDGTEAVAAAVERAARQEGEG